MVNFSATQCQNLSEKCARYRIRCAFFFILGYHISHELNLCLPFLHPQTCPHWGYSMEQPIVTPSLMQRGHG